MNISKYLKTIGKTKTELADELGLSRPTLNQYIELFENGNHIDNERYDIIFNRLFSDGIENKELFDRKIESIKILLERDRKYDIGLLSPEAADLVANIHNIMVNDLSSDDWDRKVYDTISIFLVRYKEDVFFRNLSGYFSDLNSDSDISEISDLTKAYYSYFFQCFRKLLIEQPVYKSDEYNLFLERRACLIKDKADRNAQKTKKIKDKINNTLKEVEKEFMEKGLDASEDDIVSELVRRMRG